MKSQIIVPAILSLGIAITCAYLAIANPKEASGPLTVAVATLNFWAKSPVEKINETSNN